MASNTMLDDDFLPLFQIEFPEVHQEGGDELFVIEFTKNKFNNMTSSVTVKIFDFSKTEISEVSLTADTFRVILFHRSYSFTTMEILVKLCKVYQYLTAQTPADQFKMEIVNDSSGDVSFTTNDAFIRQFGNVMENLYVAYFIANGKSAVQNINEFDDIHAQVTLGDYKNINHNSIEKLQKQNPSLTNSSELIEDAFYLLGFMKHDDGPRLSEVNKRITELTSDKRKITGQTAQSKQAKGNLQTQIGELNVISIRLSKVWMEITNQPFYAAMYKRIQEFKLMTEFPEDVVNELDVYKKILAKTKTQHKQFLERVLVETNSIYSLKVKIDAADPQALAAALAASKGSTGSKEPTPKATEPTPKATEPTEGAATTAEIGVYNNYLLRLMKNEPKINKFVGPIIKILDRETTSKLTNVIEYLKSDSFNMSWYELYPSLLNEIINLSDKTERLAKLEDYVRFLKLKHTYPSDITIDDYIGTVRISRNISSKLRTIIHFDEYFMKYEKETLGLQSTPEAEQILMDLDQFLETLDSQHFNAAQRESEFHTHINLLMRFTDPSFATKKLKTDGTSFNTVVKRQLAAAKASDYHDRNVNKALFDAIQYRDDALNSRHYVQFNSNPEYPTMEHKRFFWTHILPDLKAICLSTPSPRPSPRNSSSTLQDVDKLKRMRKLILPFFQFVVLNSKHKNLDIFKDYVTVVKAKQNMRLELRFLISKESNENSPSSVTPTRKRSRRGTRLTRFTSRRRRKEEEEE